MSPRSLSFTLSQSPQSLRAIFGWNFFLLLVAFSLCHHQSDPLKFSARSEINLLLSLLADNSIYNFLTQHRFWSRQSLARELFWIAILFSPSGEKIWKILSPFEISEWESFQMENESENPHECPRWCSPALPLESTLQKKKKKRFKLDFRLRIHNISLSRLISWMSEFIQVKLNISIALSLSVQLSSTQTLKVENRFRQIHEFNTV